MPSSSLKTAKHFAQLLQKLEIPQPENGIARSLEEARIVAEKIGYPVLVRPSFVLGGRAMALVEREESLNGFIASSHRSRPRPAHPDR